jgi:hypothetical protein
MRSLSFWAVFWALLLLPAILVALGRRASALRAESADEGSQEEGVQFARWFAAASSLLPVVLLLSSLLPGWASNSAFNALTL